MRIQSPNGTRQMQVGNDHCMWFRTRVDGRWNQWTQHYSRYNGLMEFNEALHFLGWKEIKPVI